MVGQKVMLSWLSELAPVVTKFGWETSNTRKHLGLIKNKVDKSIQSPETHAVDGIALAATQFVSYQSFQDGKEHGHDWKGDVEITPAPFKVVSKPNLYRRQLHFVLHRRVENESGRVAPLRRLDIGLAIKFRSKPKGKPYWDGWVVIPIRTSPKKYLFTMLIGIVLVSSG
jgi:hypothetical protein